MPRIYISHRPEDSSRNEVRVIRERLVAEFGDDNVMDTAGDHMHTTIQRQAMVESCDVLLVVIGRHWLNMVDEQENSLLDDPIDPVHVEISSSEKSVDVIKLLFVDGAEPPERDRLPEVIRWRMNEESIAVSNEDQLTLLLETLAQDLSTEVETQVEHRSTETQLLRSDPVQLTQSTSDSSSSVWWDWDDPNEIPRDYIPHDSEGKSNVVRGCVIIVIIVLGIWGFLSGEIGLGDLIGGLLRLFF